jgi:hypothetical protein
VGGLDRAAIGRVKVLDETVGTIALGFQALPEHCWLL